MTNVSASSVLFGDLVDSASGVPAGRLSVVSAGPITFSGSIGSLNQLVSLDVSGGGLTTINDTLNIQSADFHNNTLLGSNLHLTNGQYTFRQKLNSARAAPSRWTRRASRRSRCWGLWAETASWQASTRRRARGQCWGRT